MDSIDCSRTKAVESPATSGRGVAAANRLPALLLAAATAGAATAATVAAVTETGASRSMPAGPAEAAVWGAAELVAARAGADG